MALNVDGIAERAFARIVGGLRSVRLDAGLSQNALARGLPVLGRAISEWETGGIEPTLNHLIQWSGKLNQQLVITGRDGVPVTDPVLHRPGESWEVFERRRLAAPLRHRRVAVGLSQEEFGELVGVTTGGAVRRGHAIGLTMPWDRDRPGDGRRQDDRRSSLGPIWS